MTCLPCCAEMTKALKHSPSGYEEEEEEDGRGNAFRAQKAKASVDLLRSPSKKHKSRN